MVFWPHQRDGWQGKAITIICAALLAVLVYAVWVRG